MSKDLRDFDMENLSEEDIEYFGQRPWLKTEYHLQTEETFEDLLARTVGDPDEDEDNEDGNSKSAPVDDFPSYTDKPRPEGWENFSDDEKRAYIYDTGNDSGAGSGDDEDEEPEDYSDLDFAGLKAEIDRRNAEIEDEEQHLSKGGSADDLRARLVADDEALEEGEE